MPEPFDPITLEILWSRLFAIADEAAATLVRTSFSPVLRESNDYACALLDAAGYSLADNTGSMPSFVGTMPRTCRWMLERIPRAGLEPGDVLITNDPWLATGHLPDVTMVAPIFFRGRLVAFAGMIGHMSDMGGSLWSADAQEVFEEGLRIPPCKLFRRGEVNREVAQFIEANVRVPDKVWRDLHALLAAGEIATRGVHELLEDRGMDDLGALSRAIQGLAEGSMREAIRAAKPGTYTNALELDGYDEPLTIRAAVTIAGDQVTVDFAGTSPQIGRGINCVMNYTYAYTCFALKCLLDPLTRKNEGSFRPFVIRAPEGCLVNPRFPAPVNGRQIVGHLVVCALFGALATGFPDRVIADSGSAPTCRIVFSGRHPSGDKVSFVLFANGGMGARPDRDGLSTTPFPTNSVCAAIEVMENLAPLIVWKKELLADSGGAGEWRGGLGQEISLECVGSDPLVMSVFSDRRDHPALGFFGGRPGNPIRFILNDGGTVHPKAKSVLRPGDRLTIQYAGGGGFGPPERRGRDQVLADLRSGYITGAAAREVYRIVPDEIPDGRG